MEQSLLTPAERMYKKHKENVLAYQRKNPEKVKQKNQVYLAKIKDDPVTFEEFKKKRREYEKKWRASKKPQEAPPQETVPQKIAPEDLAQSRRIENETLRLIQPSI
jgi:hypothetical protein